MGCTKKLIPQFVCTYYLGLLPKVHSTIPSIQIQDSPPVERNFFFCVPVPGLLQCTLDTLVEKNLVNKLNGGQLFQNFVNPFFLLVQYSNNDQQNDLLLAG